MRKHSQPVQIQELSDSFINTEPGQCNASKNTFFGLSFFDRIVLCLAIMLLFITKQATNGNTDPVCIVTIRVMPI